MNLTRSNGFAPFVRSQHRGQAGYEQPTMAMLKISNDNRRTERPYIPDVISNHGYSHEMNGNTASRSVTSFNRKYEYDNPDENRSDRAPYHENERNYGRSTDTSRSSSVPTRAGHRAESGYSSSIFDEMHPVKRQRHDSGPQAALLVQTADTSFLNVPSQRTREEIEAAAYSQGAKKGG